MRTTPEQRLRRILEVVQARGTVRVTDLGTELGVAPVTARRDVETLATRGLLHRAHGSVSWPVGATGAGFGPGPDAHGPVLGMLIPSRTYYFAEVLRGAQAATAAVGARLMLGISGYRPAEDGVQVERLLEGGAQGLLLTPSWRPETPATEQADHFSGLDVPVVLVERKVAAGAAAAELDRVCSDHTHGALLAVRHLLGLGHRRIALAARRSPTATAVRAGYDVALDAFGLGEPPVPVIDTCSAETDPAGFDRAVERLFQAWRDHAVTAVVVHNDEDAIHFVQHLRARGVRIPDDLSMLAYDDEVAAFADVPLTAVAPAKRAVGRAAAELLLARMTERPAAGPRPARRHLDLLPSLVIRDSCAPLPG